MSESDDSGAGRREVAYRLFAAEFDDAEFSYSESDEERAPNYVISPTGARINRLFVVGVLTEVEQVGDDVLRARVVDPTGAFVLYAGQYQPDEQAFLERAEPPMFVAVTGKARTFQPEDSDRVFTSIRPESINEVDAETRDRWTVQTASQTIDRVGQMATALSLTARGEDLASELRDRGVSDGLAAGIPLALDHYGTTGAYLQAVREMALDAARLVADELDEVEPPSMAPDAAGEADLDALTTEESVAPAEQTQETDQPEGAAGADGTEAGGETAPETTASVGSDSTEPADEEPVVAAADSAESEPARDDAGETETDATAPDESTEEPDDIGDFDPGEFDLDEEEREEIEQEYGTEFQTGTEVDEPGEADIETPEPEPDPESIEEPAAAEAGPSETEAEVADASEDAPEPDTDETEADEDEPKPVPDDLEDVVVDVMGELDDGDGAGHDAVVESVLDRYDVAAEAVEDAIQDALMDGRCYEPDDATLKPI